MNKDAGVLHHMNCRRTKGTNQRALFVFLAAFALMGTHGAASAGAPPDFSGFTKHALPAVVNIVATTDVSATGPAGRANPEAPNPEPGLFDKPTETPPGGPSAKGKDPSSRLQLDSLGSGFIIDPSGYVVTNNHVIESAQEIKLVLTDGRHFKAKRIGVDSATDLALLKIDAQSPLPHLDWGSSDQVQVGNWVVAIGNPFGLGGSVTAGVLSGNARDIQAGPYDDFLQTDASINRGYSGGPLLDTHGKVIGINTAILSPTGGSIGISFAIPSSTAQPVIAQLRETGTVRRGQLGIHVQPVTDKIAAAVGIGDTHGAMVTSVIEESPAEQGGLKAGDIVVKYDGKAVETMRALPRYVANTKIGKTVDVKVWRDGRMIDRSVKITEQPTEAENNPPQEKKPQHSARPLTLGMRLERLDTGKKLQLGLEEKDQGVLVTEVSPDSDAAAEGIKSGDIISEIDKVPVASPGDVAQRIRETKKQGRALALLRVMRNGEFHYVAVGV